MVMPLLLRTVARTATRRANFRPLVARRGYASTRPTSVMVTQTKKGENQAADMPSAAAATASEIPSVSAVNVDSSAPLTVTQSCVNRIDQLVKGKGEDSYLRVYVDAGGCSGFSYRFELDTPDNLVLESTGASQEENDDDDDDEFDDDDELDVVVERHPETGRPRVVVDTTSLQYIRGSTIDYVQELIKSSFVVANNPQSESACGCGSSFAVKNFASNPAID